MDRRSARNPGLIALALVLHGGVPAAAEGGEEGSPRLAALEAELNGGNQAALAAFWRELQDHGPLVEEIPGDEEHRRVTFVWRGDAPTARVTVLGGLPGANILKPLQRMPGTDLWSLTERHATAARFQYAFQINGAPALAMEWRAINQAMEQNPPRLDPFNARKIRGWSYVELPGAPAQPWIARRPEVPAGHQNKERLQSRILGAEYSLRVYTPPGYERGKGRSWLLVAFDGGFVDMETTLDNLLAAGRIPPLVVIGVENISGKTRKHDLDCSESFARFLASELVPWARRTYRVHADAAHTIVGGASLGGKMAAYCGLKHSDVFGKVLSQSGSFLTAPGEESPVPAWSGETPGMLARQFLAGPRLPLDFYLEVGRYETTLPFSPLLETRRLRHVLEAKGYSVTYSEYIGGHNEVCWRGSFADAITALTRERPRR